MTFWIIILIIIAIIVALAGIVGAIVPALPGPPLCWVSMLTIYLAIPGAMTASTLWWALALTIVCQILDYVAPAILTKWGGGNKDAVRGATIGMLVGLFFLPLGMIVGPLAGAFIGEMRHNKGTWHTVRVALMSFVAFLVTTGMKLALSLWMVYECIAASWNFFHLTTL